MCVGPRQSMTLSITGGELLFYDLRFHHEKDRVLLRPLPQPWTKHAVVGDEEKPKYLKHMNTLLFYPNSKPLRTFVGVVRCFTPVFHPSTADGSAAWPEERRTQVTPAVQRGWRGEGRSQRCNHGRRKDVWGE